MDFFTLAKNRYSVRKFSERSVEPEKLEKVLEAARVAPTAHNYQPFRIYVLKSKDAVCVNIFSGDPYKIVLQLN